MVANWLCAMWSCCLPYLKVEVEDGQGDRWQEARGSSFVEVQRDGSVQLPAPAASCVRHLQELRGSFSRRLHGWKRLCHVGQGRQLREEGGGQGHWQEEMIGVRVRFFLNCFESFTS